MPLSCHSALISGSAACNSVVGDVGSSGELACWSGSASRPRKSMLGLAGRSEAGEAGRGAGADTVTVRGEAGCEGEGAGEEEGEGGVREMRFMKRDFQDETPEVRTKNSCVERPADVGVIGVRRGVSGEEEPGGSVDGVSAAVAAAKER
jgi:hypothetical protein